MKHDVYCVWFEHVRIGIFDRYTSIREQMFVT